jgi:hypothetical protein
MNEDHILIKMAAEKNQKVRAFIVHFLGHEPRQEEKKEFTFIHTLGQSKVYYKGELVETLFYNTTDNTVIC